jgi:Zn-dependent protease with chaperone function
MTRVAFDALVRKIEASALRHPALLRWSTAAWAVAGYAGFLTALAAVWLLGMSIMLGALMDPKKDSLVMLLPGAVILVLGNVWILRMVWVGLDEPEGLPVTAADTPRLMEEIESVRQALGAGPVHRVLLNAECNAGVCERLRFLFVGWPRNYLLLGLPVMDELTPDEFRALLAHEFAHLSGRHGRFSAWIYRLRRTWERIFEKWAEGPAPRGLTQRLGRWFVRWWWPRFNARAFGISAEQAIELGSKKPRKVAWKSCRLFCGDSFVLSRICEYEADRAAARLTSPEHITSGLLRMNLLAAVIDGPVQNRLLQRAAAETDPLADYTTFLRELRQSPEGLAEAAKAVREAWLIPTRNHDTHPSLTDRSRSAGDLSRGGTVIPEPPAAGSAATTLLAENLKTIRHGVDRLWVRDNTSAWRSRHLAAASQHRQAEHIGTRSRGGNAELLWEEAKTLQALHGPAAALPVVERILTIQPSHPGACMVMGRHLLESGATAQGEACLEHAMADPRTLHAAADLLHQHYRRTGQPERLQALDARLDREEETRAAADKERANVTAFDTFIPHTLTVEECAALATVFQNAPGLAAVDLAEKRLRHRPEQRLFVLSLRGQGGFAGMGAASQAEAALRHLTGKVRLPGRLLMVAAGGPLASIARKVSRQPGARIWTRNFR